MSQPQSVSILLCPLMNSNHLLLEDCLRMENLGVNPEDEELQIPDAIYAEAAQANQFCLYVRPTNPRRQNLRPMLRFLPRLWGMDNQVHGRLVPEGRAQFRFPSLEALDVVIRRGPWSFNDWMLAVGEWGLEEVPPDFPNSISFWIQIRDIPPRFFTYSVVTYIADTLGTIEESDFNLETGASRDFARVRINWPVTRPLCFQRRFRFGPNEGIPITFRYERLKNYCFRCRSLCHDVSECEDPNEDDDAKHPGDDHGPIDPVPQPQKSGAQETATASPLLESVPPANHPLLLAYSPVTLEKDSDALDIDGVMISKDTLKAVYNSYVIPPLEDASSGNVPNDPLGKGKAIVHADYYDSQLQVESLRYYQAK